MGRTRGKKPNSSTSALIWTLLVVVFTLELLFYTWCRVQCTMVGYGISDEVKNRQRLESLQSSLKIEIERLKSPERISKIAIEQLKLHPPRPEQVVILP